MSSFYRLVVPAIVVACAASPAVAGQVQIEMSQQVVGPDGPPLPGRQLRTGTGRIRGRVMSMETGAPVRRAAVRLGGADAVPGTVITDSQGRYEFMNLPDGRFTVNASKAGYVDMQYGQTRPFEAGKPVQLAEGQVVEKADITLPRGGVITGRIVDEFGEPVADAQVMAQRMRWANGRRSLMSTGRFAQTNDLGQYRLYGLPPGDYYVTASSRTEGMMDDVMASTIGGMRGAAVSAQPTSAPPTSGFVPTYFPGTPSPGEAQRLAVNVGQDTQGIDFALVAARYVRISGIVLNSEGRPVEGAMVTPVPKSADGMLMLMGGAARTTREGTFTLSKVAPGDYTLTIRSVMMMTTSGGDNTFMFTTRVGGPGGDGGGEFAAVPITVSGEDIPNLVITTSKGATLNGRATFEGERPASANNIRVTSIALDSDGNPMVAAGGMGTTIKADGTFELKGMSGTRGLRVSGLPDGWMLKAVTANGIDVTDTGIEFKGSDTVSGVDVVLSPRSTDVSGGVSDGRGGAVKDYTVVIFSEDAQRWSLPSTRWITGTRPDQDGRFHVRAMPPGAYYAVALDYVAQGEWSDPELLERVKSQGTRFTLSEGETKALDLKLTTGG